MSSLRRHEGYLLIDNRDSPGVSDELMQSMGVDMPKGAGKGLFEAPTLTCSHCQVVVVLEPRRTRARGYCPKCDHYVCDRCEAVRVATGGACKPFKQIIDEAQETAALQEQSGSSIIIPTK